VEGVGIVVADAAMQYKSEAFHGETLVFQITPPTSTSTAAT
jgi:4-hydroxybenzoyl-CoA thioesterase